MSEDYGPLKPRLKDAGEDTTKNGNGLSVEGSKTTKKVTNALHIKPPRRERNFSKEQQIYWLFFDDWDAQISNRNTFDDNVEQDGYIPVDHVSHLLGGRRNDLIAENDVNSQINKSICSESVWLKRRRAAMAERRVPCDSILMRGKIVDEDGFLVEDTKPSVNGKEGSKGDEWISFCETI